MVYKNIFRAEFISRPNRFIANIKIDGKEEVAAHEVVGRGKNVVFVVNTVARLGGVLDLASLARHNVEVVDIVDNGGSAVVVKIEGRKTRGFKSYRARHYADIV